jgi:hypothetical protein
MARRGFLARILPVHPGHPDHDLPEHERPVDPDYGVDAGHPEHPDVEPPAGVWPPVPGRPDLPIVLPPPVIWPRPPGPPPVVWPPKIDNSLPSPPPGLWPPPGSPDNSLPPTAGQLPIFPDTPGEPGTIWPPLPSNDLPESGKNYLVICWIPGVGYRWVVVDPALIVTHPIAPTPQPK